MKIFLTGTSGFIGSHLLSFFANIQEFEIGKLCSNPKNAGTNDALMRGDKIETPRSSVEFIKHVEVLIHAGSFTPRKHGEANNLRESLKSLKITQQLCSGIFPNLRKFIFLSTMDVYERTPDLVTEFSPLAIKNAYVASKLFSESEIALYCGQNNIALDIFRLGHVFGPRDDVYQKALQKILVSANEGSTFRVQGPINQKLNLFYVKDLCPIFEQSLRSKNSYGYINLVSSKPISIRHIIEIVSEIKKRNLFFSEEEAHQEQMDYNFDCSKLRQSFTYTETSIKAALEEYIS